MDNKERPMNQTQLEPRVAKLETGLEMLTKDVASLAQITRDQGNNIETQIRDLAVSVTQAAAPRRTDWQTMISLGLLILAIGSAVFWPLNQTAQNNKDDVKQLTTLMREHSALDNHPVGAALLGRLEEQLKTHVVNNDREMSQHRESDDREFKALDQKLQQEYQLANKTLEQKQEWLEKEINMVNDKMCKRVTEIESRFERQDTMDLQELREWRKKANGLSLPEMSVPLSSRQVNPPVNK